MTSATDRTAFVGTPVSMIAGFKAEDAYAMWADSVIHAYRYPTLEDRALALTESDYPALMPSSDDLDEMGVDIVGLARALEAGLNAELFGKVITTGLLNLDEFNRSLASGLDIPSYNEAMDHLVDFAADRASHDGSFVDEVLARYGD